MISLLPSSSQPRDQLKLEKPSIARGRDVSLVGELTSADDSVQYFEQMIASSGRQFVRLHCTVPTQCSDSTSVHCTDLYDLQDLRSRSLLFVHDLLKTVRSLGATYQLAPSDSDLVIIRALPAEGMQVRAARPDLLARARSSPRGKILTDMTTLGPVFVMT